MKLFLLFISIVLSITTKSQITHVSLQASGLTCSMCSNSINKALKTLDFVEKIDANIKTYTFEIFFKAKSNVDFDEIKKKVENAGFSVSAFVATIDFNNVQLKATQPVVIGNKTLLFVNVKEQSLNGLRQVRVLDKGFVSSKEYKARPFTVASPGTYHVTI